MHALSSMLVGLDSQHKITLHPLFVPSSSAVAMATAALPLLHPPLPKPAPPPLHGLHPPAQLHSEPHPLRLLFHLPRRRRGGPIAAYPPLRPRPTPHPILQPEMPGRPRPPSRSCSARTAPPRPTRPPSPRARPPTPPCSSTASASWTSSASGHRGAPPVRGAAPSGWRLGGSGSGGRCTTWGGAGATAVWCRFSRASVCDSPPPNSSRPTSWLRAFPC